MKGNRTNVGQQVEQFFNQHPRVEFSVQRVAEHLGVSPNTVGQKVLGLFEDGFLLRRMEGVARGRHYLYIKAPTKQSPEVQTMTRTIISEENLPRWVRNQIEACKSPLGHVSMWTVDSEGRYESWLPTAKFVKPAPNLPGGIDPADAVDWYDLPTWVKGSYRTEAEMRRLQSFTWVRGNLSGNRYCAYTPEGEYVGAWERE